MGAVFKVIWFQAIYWPSDNTFLLWYTLCGDILETVTPWGKKDWKCYIAQKRGDLLAWADLLYFSASASCCDTIVDSLPTSDWRTLTLKGIVSTMRLCGMGAIEDLLTPQRNYLSLVCRSTTTAYLKLCAECFLFRKKSKMHCYLQWRNKKRKKYGLKEKISEIQVSEFFKHQQCKSFQWEGLLWKWFLPFYCIGPWCQRLDVVGMAVAVEPSRQYSVICCCHTDGNSGAVWQSGCMSEAKGCHWIPPRREHYTHWCSLMLAVSLQTPTSGCQHNEA